MDPEPRVVPGSVRGSSVYTISIEHKTKIMEFNKSKQEAQLKLKQKGLANKVEKTGNRKEMRPSTILMKAELKHIWKKFLVNKFEKMKQALNEGKRKSSERGIK